MIYKILLWIFILGEGNAQTSFLYRNQHIWGRNFPKCRGRNQSPIEICSRNTITTYNPRFRFFQYRQPLPTPLIIQSKSDTVDVSTRDELNRLLPYVRGGRLRGTYQFASFHFHWGSRNNRGSEHVVNGRRFPLELHIVHKNTKYATLTDALKRRDGLMVFGILFRISRIDNQELFPIIDAITTANITKDSPLNLNAQVSLSRLMGRINRNRYFTYSGSLTIPTCNEAVTWIVFSQTTRISDNQLRVFRSFIGSSGQRVLRNFRSLQPLYCRPVFRNVGLRRRRKK